MRSWFLFLIAATVCSAQQTRTLSIGGSGLDQPYAIRTDAEGNTYVAGTTLSADFPATKTPAHPAAPEKSKVFVTKLAPDGEVQFSLVLGGSGMEIARAMTTDHAGNVYVTGWTQSEDFPVTPNAVQPKMKISSTLDPSFYRMDVFVLKLSSEGELLYSTYLGGERRDYGEAIAVDDDGNMYLAGRTGSYDFPVTDGAFQRSLGTYGLTDGAFAAKLSADGSTLLWATYLCGTSYTLPRSIAVGPDRASVIAGETSATDYPVKNAVQRLPGGSTNYPTFGGDGFVSKLSPDGSDLVFSTFLGGIGADRIRSVVVDSDNSIYVAGLTGSSSMSADEPQSLKGSVLTRLDRGGQPLPPPKGLGASSVLATVAAPSDPRIVYAGSPEGLYRSEDGGDSWNLTSLKQISVGAIVVDPRDANVLYAGSTSGGMVGNHGGLWKSTDGGANFTRLPVGPDGIWPPNYLAGESFIDFLVMDPSNPDNLYLDLGWGGFGTTSMPIYKSTDAGATWIKAGSGITQTPSGIVVDPDNSQVLYATTVGYFCCGFGGGIHPGQFLRSEDGGLNWKVASTAYAFGDLHMVSGRLYSGRFLSTDRGATWTEIPIPGKLVAYDETRLYALSSEGGVYESTDWGSTWTPIAPGITANSFGISPERLFFGTTLWNDAFVSRFDGSGALIFTRYLGGNGYDEATALSLASSGRVVVAGLTDTGTNPRAWANGGPLSIFVAELDDAGNTTFWTTAGSANVYPGVAVHALGSAIAITATSPESDVVVTRVGRGEP